MAEISEIRSLASNNSVVDLMRFIMSEFSKNEDLTHNVEVSSAYMRDLILNQQFRNCYITPGVMVYVSDFMDSQTFHRYFASGDNDEHMIEHYNSEIETIATSISTLTESGELISFNDRTLECLKRMFTHTGIVDCFYFIAEDQDSEDIINSYDMPMDVFSRTIDYEVCGQLHNLYNNVFYVSSQSTHIELDFVVTDSEELACVFRGINPLRFEDIRIRTP